jgi:hypothetical protein
MGPDGRGILNLNFELNLSSPIYLRVSASPVAFVLEFPLPTSPIKGAGGNLLSFRRRGGYRGRV